MPDYVWQGKHENGMSKGLRPIDQMPIEDVPLDTRTAGTTVVSGARCTVCGKRFKAVHVIATHIRAKHPEIDAAGDKWKKFVEEV